MTRSKTLFVSLLALAISTSCTTFKTSDFEIMVRLPAARSCFGVRVMSGKETEYDEKACDAMVSKAILLTSENWKLLRNDIKTNCEYDQCTQISGAADHLFLAIDQALQWKR